MKPLKILFYPNKKLKRTAVSVDINANWSNIQKLIKRMHETIKFYEAIGLSAPQVGINYRIITINLEPSDKQTLLTLINPEIMAIEGILESNESCLSFPRLSGYVQRFAEITVKYLDENKQVKYLKANELLAICIQHEIDHLNGILFIDHMSHLKREMILKQLKKRNYLTFRKQ